MESQFICTLHSGHYCIHRSHGYGSSHYCELKINEGYAVSSCPYRIQATELPAAAKPEEPPVTSDNTQMAKCDNAAHLGGTTENGKCPECKATITDVTN